MDNSTNTFVIVPGHRHLNMREIDLDREMMTTILVVDEEGVSLALQERDRDLVMMMIVLTKSRRKRVMNQDRSLQSRNRRERDPYLVTMINGQTR